MSRGLGDVYKRQVEKLFRELAPKYDGVNGGYVRIYKLGPRRGDGAEVCMLELK